MERPIISFKDFSFQYKSQSEPTLQHINLDIFPGEKVIIVGASGSGKSTLGHCLNGLVPFSYPGVIEGELWICGEEATDLGIFSLSRFVGTVLQDTDGQFIGMTVMEDIAFSLENDCVEQEELLQRTNKEAQLVNLLDKMQAAPHELSGGQKQRVSLAGVLINRMPILLFDEPLANLDPAAGKEAITLIDTLQKETNTTVIIIEHRLEDALHMGADRIILMEDGRIKADRLPSALFASDALINAGIREPLYITAMKYAGVCLDKMESLSPTRELVISEQTREKIRQWFYQDETLETKVKREPILQVEELSFGYEEEKKNLDHIDFIIDKGEMISIVGKNGAGKSTLAKLLCGFERLSDGVICHRGRDITTDTIKERATYIGYVMQNPNQMISKPMIFDEVAMSLKLQNHPPEVIQKKVWGALKKCGLYEFRSWPISALSYGQKKRVTIASILVQEPEILIMDEPTAGQDFRHYTEFMEFLKELNDQGVTVIMITHDMHLMLEYTNRCLVFAEGKLIADISPAKLFADNALIDRASLKETSLFMMAQMCGIEPREYIEKFIRYDRQVRK